MPAAEPSYAPSLAVTAAPALDPLEIPWQKRALDLCVLLLALPVLAPLMALIAGYVRLVSPGPVLFRQQRVGFAGRRFTLLKFRSMRPDADPGAHKEHTTRLYRANLPLTKIDDSGDPRLIPLGWLLRASGLDELPQVLNVLRGEMSLVGPRPCTLYEYSLLDAPDRRRFDVVPGLTGLWQVSGKNQTTFTEMIALDIAYARCWGVGLDVQIMVRTFPVLVRQVLAMVRRQLWRRSP